jgi:hypothetical protein
MRQGTLWQAVAARVRTLHDNQPMAIPLAAAIMGLLFGWLVLGWLVFPVEWTDARPVDLAPEARQSYIQLVADAFVSDRNVSRARARVTDFPPEVLAGDIGILLGTSAATGTQSVGALAAALAATPQVVPVPTPAPARGSPGGWANLTRTIALAALMAALAAGIALWWAARRWRGDERPAPPDGHARSVTVVASPRGEPSRARGAPPWRPLRIDLGATATARFTAGDEHYYQTWLVYDERGGLVGGAGLQAHAVGSVSTLDLWFFKRDDEDADVETPTVTIVSPEAFHDGVFRARLGDRQIVAALPGQGCVLEAADLVLDVRLQTVEPAIGTDQLGVPSLTLALTPRRIETSTEAEESDPPVPLPFRRD